jgi:hypothetical protein
MRRVRPDDGDPDALRPIDTGVVIDPVPGRRPTAVIGGDDERGPIEASIPRKSSSVRTPSRVTRTTFWVTGAGGGAVAAADAASGRTSTRSKTAITTSGRYVI